MFNPLERSEKRRELARARSSVAPRPFDLAIVVAAVLVVVLLPAGSPQPTTAKNLFEPSEASRQLSRITPIRVHRAERVSHPENDHELPLPTPL